MYITLSTKYINSAFECVHFQASKLLNSHFPQVGEEKLEIQQTYDMVKQLRMVFER